MPTSFGGNASKVFTLVYNLPNTEGIYQRFPGVDGSLYVVEISSDSLLADPPAPGKLIRIKPDGSREELGGDLTAPYAVALEARYAYVTTHSTEPGAGHVVRIRLPGAGGDDD